MRSFLKSFLACLLALIIFSFLLMFFVVAAVSGKEGPKIRSGSVLVLDLGQHFPEQLQKNALGFLSGEPDNPGLYDAVRLVQKAAVDKNIEGIYVITNGNANGFAASEEIRNALVEFKKSGKFILAHGDVITQRAYSVANVADKVYVSPQGYFEWIGYSIDLFFLKGTLDKLQIDPQIFYAGKFKSATEPLRLDRMTPENELQTSVWLHDLYNDLLVKTAAARNVDTASLHVLANEGKIRRAQDAVDNKLVDALKYDDEFKDEIKTRLKLDKFQKIEFVTMNTYLMATDLGKPKGDKIALIYAEGDIIDGKSGQGSIGSETYRNLVRKARLDKSIKAIVLRVNSGGGSSMASESIWRELSLARKDKPVVVSFGDVAASGGYYIACAADSIFSLPTTITGSIGVFGIIPNMQGFFNNKLGITFDGVKTGPYADGPTVTRPMNENEKQMVQEQVNLIYSQFKQRVSEGRKIDTASVDSIAQGRVWTGVRAKEIGLVDRLAGLDEAIRSAARMAKLTDYRVREYPEPQNLLERIFGKKEPVAYLQQIRNEIGEENFKIYMEMRRVKEMTQSVQARLPFQFTIQ
ncbi:MAG: signal peptide peptidase SppA [Chitinophagaceae bacterium]|nr:signal peptide peptidase SppA [Chitinophagaceae bacterium]